MVAGAIAGNISAEATTPTGNGFAEAMRGIAVTQEVTQTRWRSLCLEFMTERTKFHVPRHGAPDEPCPRAPLRDLL
jgi:hypothetical protein